MSGTEKSINGTALYRATQDEFREFIFKAYIESEESLIQEFEKESIVLIVGHYVYKEKIEYICIIKSSFYKKK